MGMKDWIAKLGEGIQRWIGEAEAALAPRPEPVPVPVRVRRHPERTPRR